MSINRKKTNNPVRSKKKASSANYHIDRPHDTNSEVDTGPALAAEGYYAANSTPNPAIFQLKGGYCPDVDLNGELSLVYAGHERVDPGYSKKVFNQTFYRLVYSIQGQITLIDNQRTHEIGPGMVVLFKPGQSVRCECARRNHWEYLYIHFTGSKADELISRSGLGSKRTVHLAKPEKIRALFENLLEESLSQEEPCQEMCANYLRILLLKLSSLEVKTVSRPSQTMTNYIRCKNFIDQNFQKIRLIKEVAEEFEINPEYMSHIFKKFSDSSPYQYLMRLKLNRAAVMLLEDQLLIKQIARGLNFSDPYNFSKSFKKYHGISPNVYKKMYS